MEVASIPCEMTRSVVKNYRNRFNQRRWSDVIFKIGRFNTAPRLLLSNIQLFLSRLVFGFY